MGESKLLLALFCNKILTKSEQGVVVVVISWRSGCVTLTVTLQLYRGGECVSESRPNKTPYLRLHFNFLKYDGIAQDKFCFGLGSDVNCKISFNRNNVASKDVDVFAAPHGNRKKITLTFERNVTQAQEVDFIQMPGFKVSWSYSGEIEENKESLYSNDYQTSAFIR